MADTAANFLSLSLSPLLLCRVRSLTLTRWLLLISHFDWPNICFNNRPNSIECDVRALCNRLTVARNKNERHHQAETQSDTETRRQNRDHVRIIDSKMHFARKSLILFIYKKREKRSRKQKMLKSFTGHTNRHHVIAPQQQWLRDGELEIADRVVKAQKRSDVWNELLSLNCKIRFDWIFVFLFDFIVIVYCRFGGDWIRASGIRKWKQNNKLIENQIIRKNLCWHIFLRFAVRA